MDALLLTHACQYVGPGAVPVLLREQRRLVCHDTGFVDPDVARNFETHVRDSSTTLRDAGKSRAKFPWGVSASRRKSGS